MDQSREDTVSGPDWNDKNYSFRISELLWSISSQVVSVQVKFDVMQRAVATCPKVYTWAAEGKRSLHCLTLVVKSL